MSHFNYDYDSTYEDEHEEDRTYEFLMPQDVMEQLGIGRNTFYRLVNSGELPAFRIGKLWRVRRSELEKWRSAL